MICHDDFMWFHLHLCCWSCCYSIDSSWSHSSWSLDAHIQSSDQLTHRTALRSDTLSCMRVYQHLYYGSSNTNCTMLMYMYSDLVSSVLLICQHLLETSMSQTKDSMQLNPMVNILIPSCLQFIQLLLHILHLLFLLFIMVYYQHHQKFHHRF